MAQTFRVESISHWRQTKSDIIAADAAQFADTVGLLDQILAKYSEIHDAVMPIPAGHELLLLDFMLLGTHRTLLNAADLMLQRQRPEAFALLRPVLEMAAAAAKIGRKPELAKVWVKRGKDDVDDFKTKFPKGDPLTGPLYKAWGLTSDNGSHGNVNGFLLNVDISDRMEIKSYYALLDSDDLRRTLIHFLEMCSRILNVYIVSLKPVAKTDLGSKVVILKSAIDVHKEKYRPIFEAGIKSAGAGALRTPTKP